MTSNSLCRRQQRAVVPARMLPQRSMAAPTACNLHQLLSETGQRLPCALLHQDQQHQGLLLPPPPALSGGVLTLLQDDDEQDNHAPAADRLPLLLSRTCATPPASSCSPAVGPQRLGCCIHSSSTSSHCSTLWPSPHPVTLPLSFPEQLPVNFIPTPDQDGPWQTLASTLSGTRSSLMHLDTSKSGRSSLWMQLRCSTG